MRFQSPFGTVRSASRPELRADEEPEPWAWRDESLGATVSDESGSTRGMADLVKKSCDRMALSVGLRVGGGRCHVLGRVVGGTGEGEGALPGEER